MALLLLLGSLPLLTQEQERPAESENRPSDQELLPTRFDVEAEHVSVEPRVGFWAMPGFEAFTARGLRRIRSTSLLDAGLDAAYRIEGWSLSLSFDYAAGDDVTVWIAGLHAGFEAELPFEFVFPVLARVAAGAIGGALDVDEAGFGDFEPAIGGQIRGALEPVFDGGIGVSLWADFRYLEFEYDEPVTNGDVLAMRASFAAGLGFSVRF